MSAKFLATGAAGFIGSHLSERLAQFKYQVIGLGNFNDFYSPATKWHNINSLANKR
jgi:UDP-glucuronate 4-epimerase